ncbi:hypothetical protein E2C01_041423 [Portunus trituberculatus]|uniref:Uncharacterized protein n=1 Tax=Portunus trituberculatus TaxID=210409 RepID=A0A5B7FJ81_PORTR|nr:hypothetical protein [Portunus trituberculatus]
MEVQLCDIEYPTYQRVKRFTSVKRHGAPEVMLVGARLSFLHQDQVTGHTSTCESLTLPDMLQGAATHLDSAFRSQDGWKSGDRKQAGNM